MIYPGVKTLLKDLNCVRNATESTRLCLNVLFDSVNRLKCREQDIPGICRTFADAVKTARPANAALMHLLDFFEHDLKGCISSKPGRVKQLVLDSLEEKIDQLDRYGKYVAENGLVHVNDGDTIFLLEPDQVIEDILIQARHELGRRFKVVGLELCGTGIGRTAQTLASKGIDVLTLASGSFPDAGVCGPARLFMGGMAVTADRKILAPEGTAQIIDRCRSRGVNVHLFAASLWFSQKRSTDRYAFRQDGGGQDVALAVTPGDLVCFDAIDHIVTEFGEIGDDGCLSVPPVSLARLKAIDVKSDRAARASVHKAPLAPNMSAA